MVRAAANSRSPAPAGRLGGLAFAAAALAGGLAGAARAADVPFKRITIDPRPPERPWYKMLGDLDGDGQLDIVVAGARGPLVWYAYPDWSKHEIAQSGWNGVNGEIGDVDGDGDNDIVMGGVVWLANPGGAGGRWVMHTIDRRRAHDIELGDVNGDGRLDVVARDQSAFGGAGDAIYVYTQQGPTAWRPHKLGCPHGEGLKLADLDADGDPDIVIGGRWWENQGGRWTPREFSSAWTEPDAKVDTADLNGDGRLDVVLTPAELRGETYRVAWYESPAAGPTTGPWPEHVIVAEIECVVHGLALGDMDNDGRVDVVIAEMHQGADPDEVSLYLNLGRGLRWRKQLLSTDGSHDLVVGDIDNDGDLDIVGANHGGPRTPVELWRNEGNPRR